ncbi:MAG: NAD(P)/FAD-dependent oxidoreductase [Patescibacteria group bacterium]
MAEYDLIVIGGGAAGMMVAGRVAEKGARVLLLEKNNRLGVKLSITGKGRCNITKAEFDNRKFIENLGKNGKFFFSALYKFGVQDVINFFESSGLELKTERGGRVFPKSDQAKDVVGVLIEYCRENKVKIQTKAEVIKVAVKNNKIEKIILADGQVLTAKKYAICTGGKSYPGTGSTGEAYAWLAKMGHTVIKPMPALAPVITHEKWIKEIEGASLKNVKIAVFQNNKKQDERFGEALFTGDGMSGPIILDMSKKIGELLKKGKVEISIDFKPALGFEVLDKRIQQDFLKFKNKMFKNALDMLLPKKLITVFIKLSDIDENKKVNSVTKQERKKIINLLKDFKLKVKRVDDFNKAIITVGGVALNEIDPKTMRSKIISNLYFAGEILDLDGPTGGFNLQIAWSTGYTVGDNF